MTTRLHKLYKLTIDVLTPLHIGTGDNLHRDYDYVTHAGKTWIVNESVLLDQAYQGTSDDLLGMLNSEKLKGSQIRAKELLARIHHPYEKLSLFRYVLDGEPTTEKSGSQIQEIIKNTDDQPYIPGSSLKGAIRTVLLYESLEYSDIVKFKDKKDMDPQEIERHAFAGANMERGMFPNYDLFRALQVSDTSPADASRLQLTNVKVVVGTNRLLPITIESIKKGTQFTGRLVVDTKLLGSKEMGWDQNDRYQTGLLSTVLIDLLQAKSKAPLIAELKRARESGFEEWEKIIKSLLLQQDNLKPNQFLIQLGWGTGWDQKTLGTKLMGADRELIQYLNNRQGKTIFKKTKDLREKDRDGKFKIKYLPRSRRIVMRGDEPYAPMGWIKVTMEEI